MRRQRYDDGDDDDPNYITTNQTMARTRMMTMTRTTRK